MARNPDNMSFTNLKRLVKTPDAAQRVEQLDNVLATLRDLGAVAVWDDTTMVGVLLTLAEYKKLAGATVDAQERVQWQALAEATFAGLPREALVASIKDLAERLLALTNG